MPTFEVELTDGRKFDIEADAAPTPEEVLQALGEGPQDSGQSYVSSLAGSLGRGATRVAADIPGGLGYLTGSDTLIQAGEDIEASLADTFPVNPIYQDDFAMKAMNAIGQGGSMLATAGAGGLIGRGLGAVRTGAEVASLGTAFLAGARGGGQEAAQYGLEGPEAYLRTLAGGGIELATERFLFGLGDETRAARNVLGETAELTPTGGWSVFGPSVNDLVPNPILRSGLTEGAEEFVAGAAGNTATALLAPSGVQTPGIFEGGLENFALGSIAGGVLGGAAELTAPAAPKIAQVGEDLIITREDGTLARVVDPTTTEDGSMFAPVDPATAERAQQIFAETTPIVANDNPIPPTEEAPTSSQTSLEQPATPAAVVAEEVIAPPVELTPETPIEEGAEVVTESDPVPPVSNEIEPEITETAEETPPVTETAQPTEAPSFIGISNRRVDEERQRLGLERVYEPVRQSHGQWWEAAMRHIDANPRAGSQLVASLLSSPRTASAVESALLAHEAVTRTNAREKALADYLAAPESEKPNFTEALGSTLTDLSEVYNALDLSRSEAGRSLNALRTMAARDYSLARMDMERRAANGGQLTPEQQTQTQEHYSRIAELLKANAEYQQVQDDGDAQQHFPDLVKEIRAESQQATQPETPGVPLTERLDSAAERARARIRSRGGNLNAGLNPQDLADYSIIGASYIAKGFNTLATWSQRMVQEFGEAISPYLDRIFPQAQAFHDAQQEATEETPAPRTRDTRSAMEQIAKNAAANEPLPPRLVYELIKEKVKAGAQNLPEAVQQATADLQTVYPQITERQVRDAFSGYGRVKFPSQDDLNKRLRELRRIAQLTSAIEDANARIAPMRSGQQRDKATQEVRELQKELTRVMQENGIERTTAEQQLKTSLDGVKSRLRNQIEDLNKQLATGEKRKRKPSPEYDEEAKALRARRDELKKAADALDAPVDPTPEQRIQRAVDALERNIEELERRIRERDFSDPSMEVPQTQHLQVLRDERDALKEQYNILKEDALGSPQLTQEQLNDRAVAQLNRAIKGVEAQIAGETKQRGPQAAVTPEIRALRNKLRVLREQRDAMKVKREATQEERAEATEKALTKSIETLDKRIADGQDTVPRRDRAPDSARIRALKAERDSLRGILTQMRRDREALKRDPVAEQLKRDKSALRRRIKALDDRIKRRDFSTPTRRTPTIDRERALLEIELEQKQEEWARILFEENLANRSLPAKLLDTGAQTLNTARAILTSLDVSAVLRQGGFIVLGNPTRGARNLAPMFRAFGSKEAAALEMKELQARPNYQLYKQAKLFLSDTGNVNKLTQQEEAFMSRWLEKIPTALGGGLLRGSQRAYTVFLNRLRADTFDAMLASLQNGPTPTPAEAMSIADYINVATGRGNLGKANQAAVGLNTVFFAPRLVASRFQILLGYPYFKATGRTKRLVLREYAKFLTGAALVYALGMAAQDDDDEPIETDPRSSDFGKIRFGNTRVDPLSGLIQVTVLLSRLASGDKKTASGKIVPIRGEEVPYGGATSFSVMADFARSKFSPAFGAMVNTLQGKNVVGEPTNALDEAKRMLIPMSFSEAQETMEEQGVPQGTALTILSLFGMGVQTYDPGKK